MGYDGTIGNTALFLDFFLYRLFVISFVNLFELSQLGIGNVLINVESVKFA